MDLEIETGGHWPGYVEAARILPSTVARCEGELEARGPAIRACWGTMDRVGLAQALKAHRARLSPADIGFAEGLHRRVPGLRREEVALLAGVSVDYLVRLEQGRGPHPSDQVIGALARALRLSDDERDHLHHLAD